MVKAFNWLQEKWNSFEAWLSTWWPGVKTKIVLAAGVISSAAAATQEWISGLPLGEFITLKNLAIANIVLFTLAFWLRGLGQRVDERNA